MKKLFWLIALLGAFYAHGRFLFSEPKMMSWLTNHFVTASRGDTKACEDYADDVVISLTSEQSGQKMVVEGGKDEMCGYLAQAAAAFTLLQASTNAQYDQVEVVRGGFPWLSAELKYVETTTIQARGLPTMTVVSEDHMRLVRTLSGLKIKSVTSRASGGI